MARRLSWRAVGELPVLDREAVLAAVSPAEAIERVREAFVAHHRGEWAMPPKLFLDSPGRGDFRAMPARGDGLALVKWVTSFPGNPARGLPTVTGVIVLSELDTGEPLALLDARSVTALRTGAVAAVATGALAREGAGGAAIVGCGLHGAWTGRCLAAAGYREGVCHDPDPPAAERLADELGWATGSREEALACDVVSCVTPGHQPGADGPGKAEATPAAVASCTLFCDEWEQAVHGGELTGAVAAGLVERGQVTELGAVLAGEAPGRPGPQAVTLFDSTGLAIQDLAVAAGALEAWRAGRVEAQTLRL